MPDRFFCLPEHIISYIYTFDNTYKIIYDINIIYIKTFINRYTLYLYKNDIWFYHFTYQNLHVFNKIYSMSNSEFNLPYNSSIVLNYNSEPEINYIALSFSDAILQMKQIVSIEEPI